MIYQNPDDLPPGGFRTRIHERGASESISSVSNKHKIK